MEGRGRWEWLAPLTGVAFIVVVIVSFVLTGEPPDADSSASEIVEHYVDNKDEIRIGSFLGALAGTLLVFFFTYVSRVLRSTVGAQGLLPVTVVIGATVIAISAAIDSTLSFAIAEAAEDIEPESVRTLQALWDNDFIPFVLGMQLLWLSLGIAVLQTGALPKWLGWIALIFGIAALTPIGFFAFIGGALWILIVSVILTMRARSGPERPAPAA